MNDKYNIVKKMLEDGERDLVVIGRAAGSQAKNDKNVKDGLRGYIRKNKSLELLYTSSLEAPQPKTQSQEENNSYSNNKVATLNIMEAGNWEELAESNPIMQMIHERFQELENNNNSYKDNIVAEGFVLDNKYSDIGTDEIVTVSLRLTKGTKKLVERFAKDNSNYKKVHVVSQLLEEAISQYK